LEPGLYIVPTPIGNLADMTPRGLEVLSMVDVIAAEDTRHSGVLLRHFSIDKPLVAYHDHAGELATEQLVARLTGGESVALICDAGTPLISDPGYRIVRAAQEAGHRVVPVPGPCAAVTALSAAGLPRDRFWFEGFLPAKSGPRKNRLGALRAQAGTLIFYEAPHRILEMLEDAASVLGGQREAALARELTKAFETIRRAPLLELAEWVATDQNQQRGELVVLIGPAAPSGEQALSPEQQKWLSRLAQDLPPRKAAAIVGDMTGVKARDAYTWLLAQRQNDNDAP